MFCKEFDLRLPTDYSEKVLINKLKKKAKINDKDWKQFSYKVIKKSLDARKKNDIHWLVRLQVYEKTVGLTTHVDKNKLEISYQKRNKRIIVVGSGPAGFFSAYVLQKAGYQTMIIEKGADVSTRAMGIKRFEKDAVFNPVCNYAFGEGGAGTFSDGKLTSRTKGISLEKDFVLSSYIEAGADEEIKYLTHPHLGSDNLIKIVKNLRDNFKKLGGEIFFETSLTDLQVKNGNVLCGVTNKGSFTADAFFIAPGHSSYETYKMLMGAGVQFRTKNFAIGCRVEHPQALINKAQWGKEELKGIKAAEYRLTSKGNDVFPVYTFCMCPGGVIVNASSQANVNIVNGMSYYNRDGKFANAACVAGVNIEKLLNKEATPMEALNWLESLERRFYDFSNDFRAPACSIHDFIKQKITIDADKLDTSYALGLVSAPIWEMLPNKIGFAISMGINDFSWKIKGFETGNIIGLETKTSSPIQVVRETSGLCAGFNNLFMIGEGSGYSGGIISSAVDGIKAAVKFIDG